MARISENHKLLILNIISRFSEGASLEEILIGISPPIARRTLQYQLSSLVKQGLIESVGAARRRRYKLPEHHPSFTRGKELISLSVTSKSILLNVQRPIQERTRVPYRRELLDQYVPNVTNYLPLSTRQKLHDLGKTDGERPAGTYARQIFDRLLIDLSWNSSRLEGNTYSLLETERLLHLGEAASGKDLRETQMILNHKAAIEFLIESANHTHINRYTILNLHALLAEDLLPDPEACGSLRSIPVGISGSVYQPPAIPQSIEECFQHIINTAKMITDPFEQAFFFMVHLPYLQPFEDVNKRVSRLAANLPLIRENLSPLSFIDVPESLYINALLGVYELQQIDLLRDVFVWAYERSSLRYSTTRKILGDPDPFLIKYRNQRKELISFIVKQRMDKLSATEYIQKESKKKVPVQDQLRFIEIIERELMGLHKGNIARYRLQLKEFDAWQKNWQSPAG
ncbi:MAG: Fic family protein [Verrucomicrobiota bacterium]|nr:Fic family protein [Verrucomicrobiota bacterium]